MRQKLLDRYNSRIGSKIHYWTLLEYKYSVKKRPVYLCECICGNKKEIKFINNNHMQSKSCGCKQHINKKNNKRPTPEEQLKKYSTIFNRYKRDALERKHEFKLTYEEFEILVIKNCYYCNKEPINEQWYNNRLKIKYNGIDRVDNSKGYNTENCVSCCQKCNELKKAVTKEIINKAYNFLFKINV